MRENHRTDCTELVGSSTRKLKSLRKKTQVLIKKDSWEARDSKEYQKGFRIVKWFHERKYWCDNIVLIFKPSGPQSRGEKSNHHLCKLDWTINFSLEEECREIFTEERNDLDYFNGSHRQERKFQEFKKCEKSLKILYFLLIMSGWLETEAEGKIAFVMLEPAQNMVVGFGTPDALVLQKMCRPEEGCTLGLPNGPCRGRSDPVTEVSMSDSQLFFLVLIPETENFVFLFYLFILKVLDVNW